MRPLRAASDEPRLDPFSAALHGQGHLADKQSLTFNVVQLIGAGQVNQAFRLLRPSLPSTIEIRQVIEVSEGDDLVLADPTQIQQLLINLSANAVHAMRAQGGILKVTLSSIYFGPWDAGKPAELDRGNYLRLKIEDTGTGMDRLTMERIFDPYFTTKGPGEGTGLGLAVVQSIVKNHQGAITVYSEARKGTVFNVYLPSLERQAILEEEDPATIPMGNETILLVDDEEKLLESVKKMLEHLGYEVIATTRSLEVLELFRALPEQFDLVITDYTMPSITGVDLTARSLKSDPIPGLFSAPALLKGSER
jgi:CheY-like chemotaxis protein